MLTIDSRIRIARSEIGPDVELAFRSAFDHANPDHDRWEAQRAALSPRGQAWKAGKEPPPSIETWRHEKPAVLLDSGRGVGRPEISFPRGGFERVLETLARAGLSAAIVDRRSNGELAGAEQNLGRLFSMAGRIEPFDHQIAMVDAAERGETCLVRAPTGSGKTVGALLLAERIGLPTLVLTPTDVIFSQWVAEAERLFGLRGLALGIVKGSTRRIRPLTIASVKTFSKIAAEHARTFGLVVLDEAHQAAAATVYSAVDPLACRYRVGITADERRKDKKDFLVRDVFGPVAFSVSREELVDRGAIVDTTIRLVPTEFEAPWYAELEGAARGSNEAWDRLIAEMSRDEARNELAVRTIIAVAFGIDIAASRRARVPTLVFVHRVEHATRLLADLAARMPAMAGLCVGEEPRQRDETIRAIRAGERLVGIGTYRSIGTGADLPSVEAGVCVTPTHTNRQNANQVRGRVCRVDRGEGATKTSSSLYALWDERVFGLAPLRAWSAWSKGNVEVLREGRWVRGRDELRRLQADRADAEERDRDASDDALGGLLA